MWLLLLLLLLLGLLADFGWLYWGDGGAEATLWSLAVDSESMAESILIGVIRFFAEKTLDPWWFVSLRYLLTNGSGYKSAKLARVSNLFSRCSQKFLFSPFFTRSVCLVHNIFPFFMKQFIVNIFSPEKIHFFWTEFNNTFDLLQCENCPIVIQNVVRWSFGNALSQPETYSNQIRIQFKYWLANGNRNSAPLIYGNVQIFHFLCTPAHLYVWMSICMYANVLQIYEWVWWNRDTRAPYQKPNSYLRFCNWCVEMSLSLSLSLRIFQFIFVHKHIPQQWAETFS